MSILILKDIFGRYYTMKDKRRVRKMATQIAATPTLKGKDAENLLNSLNKKPTANSKKNGEKLINFFKKLEEKRK
jgi:hypothetical protein